MAEDLVFAQKLMQDMLRGARNNAGESPLTDIVASVQEAWGVFLKKAPDICFIDCYSPPWCEILGIELNRCAVVVLASAP